MTLPPAAGVVEARQLSVSGAAAARAGTRGPSYLGRALEFLNGLLQDGNAIRQSIDRHNVLFKDNPLTPFSHSYTHYTFQLNMPVPESSATPLTRLHHSLLHTTFCGLEHSLSTATAPIHQYRGIKYATTPARFRQSTLFTEYPPVTLAITHGPICPQKRSSKLTQETLFGIPSNIKMDQDLQQDEFECLNLNITCPGGLTTRSRIPVMLWIHGGGDRGSGSDWFCDGGALVRKSIEYNKPVIVVTVNFRIGLLGFATNALIREDNRAAGEKGTGNYGLRDQRTAMEWIHSYISDFGGDPNNVTLFGLGTGAADIVLHLLSRANEEQPPLFHRAIIQSAIFEPIHPDVGSATWALSRIISALQVSTIEKFRAIEVEKLLGLGQNMRAVDDGVFLRHGWQQYFGSEPAAPAHKHHLYVERPTRINGVSHHLRPPLKASLSRSPNRSPVGFTQQAKSRSRSTRRHHQLLPRPILCADPSRQPLIIGDNSCDGTVWSLPISSWTSAGVVRRMKAICQNLSKATGLLRAYDISSSTPAEEIMDRVMELVGDGRVAWPTHCVAESAKKERGGRNVWRYVFDQEGPSRGVPHHAAELTYLFDTVPLPESAFCGGADMLDAYDVDDEDEAALGPSAIGVLPPTPPPLQAHPKGVVDFTATAIIEKCERLSQAAPTAGDEDEWLTAVVDEYSYARVRDALQERWLSFAHGEVPWHEDHVFVFGPEGETGERSDAIFAGRRRRQIWHEVLEPLGAKLVQKCGVELSRGPGLSDRC